MVVENVFPQEAYKEQFVAILGSDFLKEFFIRAEWTGADYTKLKLPQAPSIKAETLQICTHGFFLASDLDQSQDLLAMTGYGVFFLSLGKDWNLSAALAPDVPHTKTQAEITAVVRAAQLVLKRGPLLTNAFKDIAIYTDSCAVTSGLENYQPRHDHGTPHALLPGQFTKLGLFWELDRALAEINRRLKPVKIDYLIPEKNEAVKLAIEGAQRRQMFSKSKLSPMLGETFMNFANPTVQWTPDGTQWLVTKEDVSGLEEDSGSCRPFEMGLARGSLTGRKGIGPMFR